MGKDKIKEKGNNDRKEGRVKNKKGVHHGEEGRKRRSKRKKRISTEGLNRRRIGKEVKRGGGRRRWERTK